MLFFSKTTDKFVGPKRRDKYGALEKFIDYFHSQQTMVFVILDNESRAGTVKNALVAAPSQFYENRTVTKAEYIRFWNRTIEFDNFSHDEIAKAMTEVCEQRYYFTAEEIRSCKEKFDKKKGDYLSEIFSQKLGRNYELSKPKLLQALFEFIIHGRDSEFDANGEAKRPVVRLLREIIDLAARNHQPMTLDTWEKNQASGFFGNPLGAAATASH